MKKKSIIIILLFLGIITAGILMPPCGLPSKEWVYDIRKERLTAWQQNVTSYNQCHKAKAENLYEIYKYRVERKAGPSLSLVILNPGKGERELVDKYNILEDEAAFVDKIEYELIINGNEWYITEKKTYPRFFNSLWMIDQEGNISTVRQEMGK